MSNTVLEQQEMCIEYVFLDPAQIARDRVRIRSEQVAPIPPHVLFITRKQSI